MKRKKQEKGLNRAQKDAIELARKGNPIKLERLIHSYQKYLDRLPETFPENELGKWQSAMVNYYGFLVKFLKKTLRETKMTKGKLIA